MFNSSGVALELEGFRQRYSQSPHWILNGLDFKIKSGECVALVGPSGCGKSTLAKAILQLLPQGSPSEGGLFISGQDPRQLSQAKLRKLRGKSVGLIFQDPMTRLNPLMTVGGHLLDLLQAHNPTTTYSSRKKQAEELLERVGIHKKRFLAYPHEFSGGMRQRLGIALALALNPELVIADEPTTSLDMDVANKVMAELCSQCKEIGSALLLISHDLAMAGKWCERMAILNNGKIVEEGQSRQLLINPKSKTGKTLVNAARAREGEKTPKKSQSKTVLEVNCLRSWHPLGGMLWGAPQWVKAVNNVSFQLREGEALGVVGLSGCGKSTLCKALTGLTPIRGGEVKLENQQLLTLQSKQCQKARQSLQMVFQDPLASLNPRMTIGEAISDPLLIHKIANQKKAHEKSLELLEKVGLSPASHYQKCFPRELSGGQLQRVAIARALTLNPKVLICDESVSMLDAESQAEILVLLRNLQENLGLAILFITHDLSVATGFCHKIIVLNNGHIVEEGPGIELFNQPKASITRKLIESCPRLPQENL